MFKFIGKSAQKQGISLNSNSPNSFTDPSYNEESINDQQNFETFEDVASPSSSDRLIDVHVNSDSFKKVILPRIFKSPYIQNLEHSLRNQKTRVDMLEKIITNLSKRYSKQLEDLGYEKGTLAKLLDRVDKDEISNHLFLFCHR
jgi:hypothetical protein